MSILARGLTLKIDTSEYPKHHTFYCFSLDNSPSQSIQQVIERIPEYHSIPIDAMLEKVLKMLAKDSTYGPKGFESQEEDQAEVDLDAEHSDAEFDVTSLKESDLVVEALQRSVV